MRRLAWLIMPILLCACATRPPSVVDDALLVLPGTFAEHTTVADMQAMYGAPNVLIKNETDGSGDRSVVLFADDPTRRAYVTFHDGAKLLGVRQIAVRDAGSRWRGKQGVHVGMSLAELQVRNGKPFWLSGFDADKHGAAHDGWSPSLSDDDSTLGRLDVGEGEHMYFEVEVGLRADAIGITAQDYPHDQPFRSDDPLYPRLWEIVEVIGIGASTSLDDEW